LKKTLKRWKFNQRRFPVRIWWLFVWAAIGTPAVCAGCARDQRPFDDPDPGPQKVFARARSAAEALRRNPPDRFARGRWTAVRADLLRVVHRFPDSPQAQQAMQQAVALADRLRRITRKTSDQRAYARLRARAEAWKMDLTNGGTAAGQASLASPPEVAGVSPLARTVDSLGKQAPDGLGEPRAGGDFVFAGPPLRGVSAHPKKGDETAKDRSGGRESAVSGPARLQQARCWQSATRGRLVLELSRAVDLKHGVLQPRIGESHGRLFVDLQNAKTTGAARRAIRRCGGALIRRCRIGPRPNGALRVVLELTTPARFHLYPLANPYRLVIDVRRKPKRQTTAPAVRVVAVDPGHGGNSRGAVGPNGLAEKKVVLDIAHQVKDGLEGKGFKVVLTRKGDRAVALEERTAVALAAGADLFVSIHANAEPSHKRQAVETYYLDTASDEFAARLARRENGAGRKAAGNARMVLAKIVSKRLTAQSAKLAKIVHKKLVQTVGQLLPITRDGGVRRAIFYVLLTARIPSVLLEVSHISHPKGENLLKRARARKEIARAIVKGISEYARRPNRTAPRESGENVQPGTKTGYIRVRGRSGTRRRGRKKQRQP
jgi:N-acetylmuramoyl-L-alanine amidase